MQLQIVRRVSRVQTVGTAHRLSARMESGASTWDEEISTASQAGTEAVWWPLAETEGARQLEIEMTGALDLFGFRWRSLLAPGRDRQSRLLQA